MSDDNGKMKNVKYISFFTEWLEDIENLSKDQIAELTLCLLKLGRREVEFPTDPVCLILYKVYKRQIESEIKKYDARCERTAEINAKKRAAKAAAEVPEIELYHGDIEI